jgi:hypothetical protein
MPRLRLLLQVLPLAACTALNLQPQCVRSSCMSPALLLLLPLFLLLQQQALRLPHGLLPLELLGDGGPWLPALF